jgi:ribosome-associated protein
MEFALDGSEFIELKNLLKVMSLVETGGEAKAAIEDGAVKVDGEVETRKGRKIRSGMTVTYKDQSVVIKV